MNKSFSFLQNKNLSGLLLILFCVIVMSSLPFSWNKTISNAFIDLQFKIRGERQLADDIVFVFIGDEDIKSLGWPLTRDYYGYMAYILSVAGAKIIGIDILFDGADQRHPEYDTNLAAFLNEAGNVCLPMKFSELADVNKNSAAGSPFLMKGSDSTFPLQRFADFTAGMGFSNFGTEVFSRKVPLVASTSDSVLLSFGTEMALLFFDRNATVNFQPHKIIFEAAEDSRISIPVDRFGQMRLNHFGDLENLNAISFVDLLQQFELRQDSLNFNNKLVIIAASAPGISPLISTPLASRIPASLVHATVAENIIHQNFIREYSTFLRLLLILLLAIAALLVRPIHKSAIKIAAMIFLPILYWIIAIEIFSRANFVLPLFYPTIAYLGISIFSAIDEIKKRQVQTDSRKILLEEEVSAKEAQLNEAKEKLAELEDQLKQESTNSEQSRIVADERKQSILQLEKELSDLKTYIVPQRQRKSMQFADIVYSPKSKMAEVLELVAKVSSDNIPVLILGETGTGKEMIAHAIHQTSSRFDKTFVAINCGALSETLLESELFGHERGSFTGAQARRRGRFEIANGGTIFLDEITETSPKFQTRLLRVLQEGRFERLGGEQTIKTDVRVIAATNRDLQEELKSGRFRSDLFYRLNGFPISIPPLRERPEDIPLLASHFLNKHRYESVQSSSDRAMEIMQKYAWPGNVRELENVIRRAAILAQSEGRDFIRETDLGDELQKSSQASLVENNYQPLEIQILESLQAFEFSRSAITQTAKALGNRDRGTITEYFRGMCFEHLVQNNFDIQSTVQSIANSQDTDVLTRVRNKIDEYLANIQNQISTSDPNDDQDKLNSTFKGLPKKYHPHLQQVIDHLFQTE